jgi:outer membrane receptor protein involved in Fe transport
VGLKQGYKINNFVGFIDIAAFWQEYSNTIEFIYAFWDKDKFGNYLPGFKFINTGNTRVRGFEASVMGEGQIAKDLKITMIGGYTYTLPQAVNPHTVFATDSVPNKMTYIITSTDTTNNVLKYRFQHIAKVDIQLTYKIFSIGGSCRHYSFMQNVDNTFYYFDKTILPTGIKKYREKHHSDTNIIDARMGVQVNTKFNNVFNLSYYLRPLKIQSPRTFALQLSIKV